MTTSKNVLANDVEIKGSIKFSHDLIIDGKIGPGILFANMILSARALAPIERVVGTWSSLVGGAQAYDRQEAIAELCKMRSADAVEALANREQGSMHGALSM